MKTPGPCLLLPLLALLGFAPPSHARAAQYKTTAGTNDWASGLGFNAVPVSASTTSIYLSNSGTHRATTNKISHFILNSLQWDIGAWTTFGNGSLEFTNNGTAGPTVTNSTTANQNNLTISWPIQLDATLTFDQAPAMSANIAMSGAISGPGGIIKNSPRNTLTLSGTNTYSGPTAINAGTLVLGANCSISNSVGINLAAGGTLDVSAIASFNLSSSTTLNASGTSTNAGQAASIKGGTAVNLNSQPVFLTISPQSTNDTTHCALWISSGVLTLNNNPFTITNNSGSPLMAGTYRLIQVGDGSSGVIYQAGSPAYPVTVVLPDGNNGLVSGAVAAISVNVGNVVLFVAPAPPPAAGLTVTGFGTVTGNPVPPAALGVAGNVTVKALDTNGLVDSNYTGTVSLGNNDPEGSSPVSHTFNASDAGVYTFTNGVTFNTAGTWTIMATDDITPMPLTGTESVYAAYMFPLQAVTTTDASVSTHTFTAGAMTLGINTNGGGFVNHVSVNGGPDLMQEQYQYGRGWQGSVRDSLHGGDYNPTQAGFTDSAGVQASVTLTNGELRINRFNVPLFENAGFDFTKFENLAQDGFLNDGGNSDTDGFAEPAGWTQDDEVRSEFDFQGFYQDATALTGGQASAVRFWQRYSFIRQPKAILQFGPAAVDANDAPIYNASIIAQAGDISSVVPGPQLATAVDLASVIFTSYGIRLTATNGYTNELWFSGGQWLSAPLILGAGDDTKFTLPGCGLTPTFTNNPDYGFLILANGTNPATAHGFALYVPMTEVNKKCVVGLNQSNDTVAYRENRLTQCAIFFNSNEPLQASLRARYFLRGLLNSADGLPGDYEALESDQYVLYGTPNQILAGVQTLQTNLLAGTGPHNVPQTWLDAYGITNEDEDLNGNGLAAWQDYFAGLDPRDPNSKLAFTGINVAGTNVVLRWQAVSGITYDLLSTTNLLTGPWITNQAGIQGVEPECDLTNAIGQDRTFFKIQVE